MYLRLASATASAGMLPDSVSETVGRRDAADEPTGTYLRGVSKTNPDNIPKSGYRLQFQRVSDLQVAQPRGIDTCMKLAHHWRLLLTDQFRSWR
jgi:hypothetical protein